MSQKKDKTVIPDTYLGRRVGLYTLVERIGEGGMGAVYRAYSSSGEEVAIKLIKRGMDTEAILRRFHNERRILASLDHPNIARLLDAGSTEDGLPYFVMEHIPGRPVNEYCDAQRLPVDERLRLFQKICSAVRSAHSLHVIHRDIKPENILVTPDGEPKLLDFGIAKILNRDFVPTSQEITATLAPVMTPRYASPEQARGERVTPASDIYSLGVLLYELLTGRSPYRTGEKSARSLVEAICSQTPDPPSATIHRAGLEAVPITEQRDTSAGALRRTLAGDLDAIILTCLEKSPARRYASVADFSADIGRFLDGSRVRARQSRLRQTILSAARTAAGVLLVLGLLALGGWWYERHVGSSVSIRPSVAVLGFENLSHQPSAEWLGTALTEMLSTELAAGGRLRTVPGELVSRVKFELALPNAQTFTNSTLSRLRESLSADYVVLGSYLTAGDPAGQQVRLDLRLQDTKTGDVVASVSETRPGTELLTLVAGAGALLRRQLGAGEMLRADSGAVRDSLPQGGDAARNYAEGIERLRTFDTLSARDLLRNAVTAAPGHALSHAALAEAANQLGYDTEARDEARKALELSTGLSREDRRLIEGRYFEVTHDWVKAVEAYRALHRELPDNLEYGLRLAAAESEAGKGRDALATLNSVRVLPTAANDPRVSLAEAEAALAVSDLPRAREAARHAAQLGSSQGFRILAARANLLLSRVFLQMGDPQRSLAAAGESQKLYQAAGHRQGVAWALNEGGGVLTQLGDVASARARYEDALVVCRTIGDQACIGSAFDSIGVLRRREGDLQGALDMHQKGLEIRRAVGDRGSVATSLYNLGNVYETLGDLPRAREAISESLNLRREMGEKRAAALALSRLSSILRREGALGEAQTMSEQAVADLRSTGDRGGTALAQFQLGLVLYDTGNLERAASVLREALAVRRQQQDKNNTAQVLAGLALVSLAQDNLSEARSEIDESIALRQSLSERISLAQSKLELAQILLEQNEAEAAAVAAREALATGQATHSASLEAEACLALARAQLMRGSAAAARESLESANRLLRDSKDAGLLFERDIIQARTEVAAGHKDAAASLLARDLHEAGRMGFVRAQFTIRLAQLQAGAAARAPLETEARQAGYLLIARATRGAGTRTARK